MDPAPLIVEALDGRPQTWLARRAGINHFHLNRVLKGHLPCTRDVYEKCRLALPVLPPWPEIGQAQPDPQHVTERADTAA